MLVVRGGAGIGKSSLLGAAAEETAGRAGIQNLEQRRLQDAARASFLVSAVQVSSLSIKRPQCVAPIGGLLSGPIMEWTCIWI
jgi:hypothetical protein